jgi:4-oxalocrotonate tautomerase
MPIITIQFIKDVVATPEQKRELIVKMTETFVSILGDVVKPFTYCLIQETPVGEWGIAGVPMPDLAYLIGPQHAEVIARSNAQMANVIAQMNAQNGAAASNVPPQPANSPAVTTGGAAQPEERNKKADDIWRGVSSPSAKSSSTASSNGNGHHRPANPAEADAVWRGAATNGNGSSKFGPAPADHQAFFAQWFEELWNKKNYDIAYARVHPEMRAHGAGGQIMTSGPDAVIGMVKEWHKAMPDGKMTVHEVISEGDLSTIRMTWEGTHTGEFYGVKPSGKRIKVTSIGIDRIVNGLIVEGWGELDMFGMMQQMGAIPAPAGS